MKLEFDIGEIPTTIEFGVGRDEGMKQTYYLVAADADVQIALRDVAKTTWDAMQEIDNNPTIYEPSEKYASSEHVYLPLSDELAKPIRDLHEANNLAMETTALADTATVFCYFARMSDKGGRRLTGLRRATQFKGVLKNRLVRFVSDALRLIPDRVFKLDNEFDLLVDAKHVHILRPSGFEFAGRLQDAILAAVPGNLKAIQKDMDYVDFGVIQAFASRHPRAARYLASIRTQNETKNVDKRALKSLCKRTGVEIKELNGKVTVEEAHVLGFLEVLDRRRYEIELVRESPERFKAASRRKIEARG